MSAAKQILLIEDAAALARGLTGALESEDYRLTHIDEGKTALATALGGGII